MKKDSCKGLATLIVIFVVLFAVTGCGGGGGSDSKPKDKDKDGYTDQNDCNDNDSNIYVGAIEICGDGIDQDCDGADLSCDDVDNDGDGFTENQGDCNDQDESISPEAEDIECDDIDQDCNGIDACFYKEFTSICSSNSEGIVHASQYTGPGVHPIALLTTDGERHVWNDDLPSGWKSESLSTTELVACISEEEEELVESCLYSGYMGDPIMWRELYVYRYRYKIQYSLYETFTGDLVESKEIYGSNPEQCYRNETVSCHEIFGCSIKKNKRYGSHVESSDLIDALEQFVE